VINTDILSRTVSKLS